MKTWCRSAAPRMRVVTGALALALSSNACSSDTSVGEAPDANSLADVSDVSAAIDAVHWRLSWDTSAIAFEEEGWSTVSDDGFTIHVTSGELTTYSGQLVACETALMQPTWRTRLAAFDVARLWRGVAWAGHSADQTNSTAAMGRLEDLALLEQTEWTDAQTEALDYCRVHYLVARADDEVFGWFEGSEMDRVTFTMRGTWRPPGGEETAFVLTTSSAYGRLFDISPFPGANGALVAAVTRAPSRWFDGADWSANSADIARIVLANIVTTATVTVRAP